MISWRLVCMVRCNCSRQSKIGSDMVVPVCIKIWCNMVEIMVQKVQQVIRFGADDASCDNVWHTGVASTISSYMV